MNTFEPNIPVRITSLFDPKIGYLYSFDLFERDLYHAHLLDTQRQSESKSGSALKNLPSRIMTT